MHEVYESRAGTFRKYSNGPLFLFETRTHVSSFLCKLKTERHAKDAQAVAINGEDAIEEKNIRGFM